MLQPFVKLHGAGNDFIFLDARAGLPGLEPEEVRRLCNRNFGIGADGILLLTGVDGSTPRMKIFNADGTIAEMCGNGIRCFALVLQTDLGFQQNPITIQTDAGAKVCHLTQKKGVTQVSVRMGAVTHENGAPLTLDTYPESLELDSSTVAFLPVATGNPHAILFGEFDQAAMEQIGPQVTSHKRFPLGTNTEFATILGRDHIQLTVYERGVGFTLACGTGSVATVGAAVSAGLCDPEVPVRVDLPGGTLYITVSSDFKDTVMQGPAVETFRGQVHIHGKQT